MHESSAYMSSCAYHAGDMIDSDDMRLSVTCVCMYACVCVCVCVCVCDDDVLAVTNE